MTQARFWRRVRHCTHKNLSPLYFKPLACAMSEVGSEGCETHCLDCGVYIGKCGCGCNDGMSGWPVARRLTESCKAKVV